MWFFVAFSVILIIANGEESQSQNADAAKINTEYLYLARGNPVDMEIGQENQVYCKLEDPNGQIILDSFGTCRLTLDRVGSEHEGVWKLYVGYSGKVNVVLEQISVKVTEPESTTDIVKTVVIKTYPGVKMTCMLPTSYRNLGCQFRGPKGQILFASGSDDETIDGVRYISELVGSVCSVTIVDPKVADLGRWRCAMKAEDSIYYAFMEVFVDLEDGPYVNMEPIIEPRYERVIQGLENEPVTLSCSIDEKIKYCDFRDGNGTVYPVFPGMKSSSMEYVGSGFEAGECGIQMILPASENDHRWSCNIGLDKSSTEYKAMFSVNIQEYLQVEQYEKRNVYISVSATIYEGTAEYCRFVRSDGLIFTTENTSKYYNGYIIGRNCDITTYNPTPLDREPWTIFAKLRHMNWEVNKQTSGLLYDELVNPVNPPPSRNSRPIFLWLLGAILFSFVLTFALAPKKNRNWVRATSAAATARAASVRQSFRKTPLKENEPTLPLPATATANPPPYAQTA